MDAAQPCLSQLTSTPTIARDKEIGISNPFESLYLDAEADTSFSGRPFPAPPGEHPLPEIPAIPNLEKLNETQKAVMMLRFAEQMGLKPGEGILPISKTLPSPTATSSSATKEDLFVDFLTTAPSASTASASAASRPMGAKPATAAAAAAAGCGK